MLKLKSADPPLTIMSCVVLWTQPSEKVTVSLAVFVPVELYVKEGFCIVEFSAPLLLKSHDHFVTFVPVAVKATACPTQLPTVVKSKALLLLKITCFVTVFEVQPSDVATI